MSEASRDRSGSARAAFISVFRRGLVFSALLLLCVMGLSHQAEANAPFVTARFRTPAPAQFESLCSRYSWLCATSGANRPVAAASLDLVEKVNLRVNRSTPEISDLDQYGRDDVWALPTARGGDCEDIAMLKKKELVARGLPPEDLAIASVLTRDGENHAVLLIRTSAGDYVLDNLSDRLLPWMQTGYTFLSVQDFRSPTKWDAVLEGGMIVQATAEIRRK